MCTSEFLMIYTSPRCRPGYDFKPQPKIIMFLVSGPVYCYCSSIRLAKSGSTKNYINTGGFCRVIFSAHVLSDRTASGGSDIYIPGRVFGVKNLNKRIERIINNNNVFVLKKKMPYRPSEHPPVLKGENNVKTFIRWDDHRLQRQNLFMALKRIPDGTIVTLGQQYNVGEKPTLIL